MANGSTQTWSTVITYDCNKSSCASSAAYIPPTTTYTTAPPAYQP